MYVRHLSVADFRSWGSAELALEPGPVVLVGSNGQGKTNLVEALGYVATLGSHRVSTDAPLVRVGAEQAIVRAAVVADGRQLRAEIEIVPGRTNRARLNGAPLTRPRELLGVLRTVLFAPEDLAVVRGDPGERRRFLDELATARTPRIAGVRADYERVLRQRAALLKTAGAARRGNTGALETLDVWDRQLADHGAALVRARLETLAALRPHAAAAYATVAGDRQSSGELTLDYASSLAEQLPQMRSGAVPDVDELTGALVNALAASRPAELDRGVNLVGPHRDDLDLAIGGLPVRGYASHGESWSTALALRLGSFDLLRADALPGGDPVLVLDDVFAELDDARRAQLAEVAASAEQTLITAAVAADVPASLTAGVRHIAEGRISESTPRSGRTA